MFSQFFSLFTTIVAAPFAALDSALSSLVVAPGVRAIGVCVVASAVYTALCYLVSFMGWRYHDYAYGTARYWWLPVRGIVLQVAAKLLLAAAFVAVFVAIWSGYANYSYRAIPEIFRILCWVTTIGSIVVPSLGLYNSRIASDPSRADFI